MSQPITVLVPAYNSEATITPAINSVLNQTYPNWELVIADDGSTDRTAEVVSRIKASSKQGSKITLVKLEHGGCAHATHEGIIRCRSDLITILDSDDMLYPNSLQVIAHRTRPDLVYVWTKFRTSSWGSRDRAGSGWSRETPMGMTLKETFLETGWWNGAHQRAFRRSSYINDTPMLDQRWQTAVDLQLCLLMAGTGRPTLHIPEFTYWYRKPGGRPSLSAQRGEQRKAHKEMLGAWRRRMRGL